LDLSSDYWMMMPSYCSGYDQLRAHLADSYRLREVTDALNIVLYTQNVP